MNESADRIRREFENPEYRHAYAESRLNTALAAQIVFLREQRGWTQEQLGLRAGMPQSAISRIESVDYAKWNVTTLRKLARAFDITVNISFESFGEFLRRLPKTRRANLEKPSFSEDLEMRAPASVAPEWTALRFTVQEGRTPLKPSVHRVLSTYSTGGSLQELYSVPCPVFAELADPVSTIAIERTSGGIQ